MMCHFEDGQLVRCEKMKGVEPNSNFCPHCGARIDIKLTANSGCTEVKHVNGNDYIFFEDEWLDFRKITLTDEWAKMRVKVYYQLVVHDLLMVVDGWQAIIFRNGMIRKIPVENIRLATALEINRTR